jgi:Ca2+-binding RTX toxin-like protein
MGTIVSSSGNEALVGTPGNDVFKLEGGNHTITGNGGIDTIDFEDAPPSLGININLGNGVATGWGNDTFTGITQAIGSLGNDTIVGSVDTTYLNGFGGNDSIVGGAHDSTLVGGPGNDTIVGGAGNDDIAPGGGNNSIDGGGGYNAIDYRGLPGGVSLDLYVGAWHPGGFDTLKNIQNVFTSDFSSTIKGDYTDNIIVGGAGNDTVMAREGNDVITGGGGNDLIDGGPGNDIAVYSGAHTDYKITANAYGWVITDTRAGSPDGTDTVRNVERLTFSDGTVALGYSVTLDATVSQAISSILRQDPVYDSAVGVGHSNTSALGNYLSYAISNGTIDTNAAVKTIIQDAGDTSSVATLAYQFFTGSAPSAAGMDYLLSPTGPNTNNLNSDYYQSFTEENRFINFAVNLGKVGAGAASFKAAYDSMSLFDVTRDAYTKIFGGTPSDTKIHALLDPTFQLNGVTMTRADYFAYYGGDGASGIGTKAAMVGWLLSEAVKADLGTYALSNDAFLNAVALHNGSYGVDIVGHYSQPSFAYQPG